jgi:methyl-accepting chemotaxis protein
MIGQIDHSAREQTDAANGIAENIADIDSISRSTSESSRSVAEKIDQLSARAKDLRGHLSRFKVD